MSTLNDLSMTVNKNVLTPISRMVPGDIRGRLPGGMQGLTSNLSGSAFSVAKTALIYGGMVAAGLVTVVGTGGAILIAVLAQGFFGGGTSMGGGGGLPTTT